MLRLRLEIDRVQNKALNLDRDRKAEGQEGRETGRQRDRKAERQEGRETGRVR